MSEPHALTPSMDTVALRKALGQFATGVAIATTLSPENQPIGLTINSFSSLSMHPPLITWSLHQSSLSLPHFMANEHFAIHILQGQQQGLAEQFYQKKSKERFEQVDYWLHPEQQVPVLTNVLAWFSCRLHSTVVAGDHTLLIGEVMDYALESNDTDPLLFFRSAFFSQPTLG